MPEKKEEESIVAEESEEPVPFSEYALEATNVASEQMLRIRERYEKKGGGTIPSDKIAAFLEERDERALALGLQLFQAAGVVGDDEAGKGTTLDGVPVEME